MKKTAVAVAICSVYATQANAGSELRTLIDMLHKNGTVDSAQHKRLLDEIKQ